MTHFSADTQALATTAIRAAISQLPRVLAIWIAAAALTLTSLPEAAAAHDANSYLQCPDGYGFRIAGPREGMMGRMYLYAYRINGGQFVFSPWFKGDASTGIQEHNGYGWVARTNHGQYPGFLVEQLNVSGLVEAWMWDDTYGYFHWSNRFACVASTFNYVDPVTYR